MDKITTLQAPALTVSYSLIQPKTQIGKNEYKWFKFRTFGSYNALPVVNELYTVTYILDTMYLAN